jgi:hypothetical protein
VHLYVDYTMPVEVVRKKLNEIAAQPKLWNGKVVNLQVTKCTENTMQLRALVSEQQFIGHVGPALRGTRETNRISGA